MSVIGKSVVGEANPHWYRAAAGAAGEPLHALGRHRRPQHQPPRTGRGIMASISDVTAAGIDDWVLPDDVIWPAAKAPATPSRRINNPGIASVEGAQPAINYIRANPAVAVFNDTTKALFRADDRGMARGVDETIRRGVIRSQEERHISREGANPAAYGDEGGGFLPSGPAPA